MFGKLNACDCTAVRLQSLLLRLRVWHELAPCVPLQPSM